MIAMVKRIAGSRSLQLGGTHQRNVAYSELNAGVVTEGTAMKPVKRRKKRKRKASVRSHECHETAETSGNMPQLTGGAVPLSAAAAFCHALARLAQLEVSHAARFVKALPDAVTEYLNENAKLCIRGLCTFARKECKAREAGKKVICGKTVTLKPKDAKVVVRASVHISLKNAFN